MVHKTNYYKLRCSRYLKNILNILSSSVDHRKSFHIFIMKYFHLNKCHYYFLRTFAYNKGRFITALIYKQMSSVSFFPLLPIESVLFPAWLATIGKSRYLKNMFNANI